MVTKLNTPEGFTSTKMQNFKGRAKESNSCSVFLFMRARVIYLKIYSVCEEHSKRRFVKVFNQTEESFNNRFIHSNAFLLRKYYEI